MKHDKVAKPLRAIYDDDLDTLLESLKIRHDLQAGRLRCRVCGVTITRENLLALLPDSGQVTLICSDPICLKGFLRASQE